MAAAKCGIRRQVEDKTAFRALQLAGTTDVFHFVWEVQVITKLEISHEKQDADFGSAHALTAFAGFRHPCFSPGAWAIALQRSD
jgi:hypothetical protein